MSRQLLSVGYEGTTIDKFIANLLSNEIECVLDVRAVPLSRKSGFSKTALAEKLERAQIRYVHLRELGAPKPLREELKLTGDYSTFFKAMDRRLAGKPEAIESAYAHVTKQKCCLMCFEHLATQCHRSVVAKRIKIRDGNGLSIRHI